jgi:hypothetical protein
MTPQRALNIAKASEATLVGIQKALLRIDAPSILLNFSADCSDRTYTSACNMLKESRNDFWDLRSWKKVFNSQDDSLYYGVLIYARQEDIEATRNGERVASNLKFVQGGDEIRNDRESFVSYIASDKALRVYIVDKSPFAARNDETILSFPDLVGKYAVVSGQVGTRGRSSPRRLTIRMKDGESVG